MLQTSVTKIIIHNTNATDILLSLGEKFSFNAIVKMPENVIKLEKLEREIVSIMHPNYKIALYYFLSQKCSISPDIMAADESKNRYFDIDSELDVDSLFKLEDDILVSIPHMLSQNIDLLYSFGEAIYLVICDHGVGTSREWREKFWFSRYDAFDSSIEGNRIEFRTSGSTPLDLLEQWINSNQLTCDISNLQVDFEYWSFSSYKDGVLTTREDTLDTCLLKVLMMIEEKKPTAQTFKQIYNDCYAKKIPKQLLDIYMNGEAYSHL